MLMGEFHHNIDQKLRLIIPSKFREELGERIIITRGLEGCLFIYSEDEWLKIVTKLKSLPFTKKDARNFNRIFISGATICEFDKQGRIKLSNPLINYASILKECVVIGVTDRLEIWGAEKWNSFLEINEDSYADIADNLFSTNFEE